MDEMLTGGRSAPPLTLPELRSVAAMFEAYQREHVRESWMRLAVACYLMAKEAQTEDGADGRWIPGPAWHRFMEETGLEVLMPRGRPSRPVEGSSRTAPISAEVRHS